MEPPTDPIRLEPGQLTPDGARTADHLFNTYGGRLYAYFWFMLGTDDAALRALEDTVAGAAGDTGQVPVSGQSAVPVFMRARVECRRQQHAAAMSAGNDWAAGAGPAHGTLMGLPAITELPESERLAEVARLAVARLAPDVREAFIMSAPHNELSLPDLAQVLNLTPEVAADLRAQAGLDFVRALSLCAEEAGYTAYSGAELRRRAEESLARDAAAPPPRPSPASVDPVSPVPAPPAPASDPGPVPPATHPTMPIAWLEGEGDGEDTSDFVGERAARAARRRGRVARRLYVVAGGGIVAVAVAALTVQAVMPNGNGTTSPTHGSASVSPGAGHGRTLSPPGAPSKAAKPAQSAGPSAGTGNQPGVAAPAPPAEAPAGPKPRHPAGKGKHLPHRPLPKVPDVTPTSV